MFQIIDYFIWTIHVWEISRDDRQRCINRTEKMESHFPKYITWKVGLHNMKKYESVTVTNLELASITCNKCGKTTELSKDDPNKFYKEYLFQSFSLNFGYGSKFDDETWKFDICEDCLEQFVNTFAIKPDIMEG